jgi:hypothetical protein
MLLMFWYVVLIRNSFQIIIQSAGGSRGHVINALFLAELALKLYSCPTSEAFIERLFSVLKYILGKSRLSLDIKILLPLLRLRGVRILTDIINNEKKEVLHYRGLK